MNLSDLPWERHVFADAFDRMAEVHRRFDPSVPEMEHRHAQVLFPNGYAASVCHGPGFSAFPDRGLYALAVFHVRDGRDPPDMPEALSGIEHQCDEEEAQALLDALEALPPRP